MRTCVSDSAPPVDTYQTARLALTASVPGAQLDAFVRGGPPCPAVRLLCRIFWVGEDQLRRDLRRDWRKDGF